MAITATDASIILNDVIKQAFGESALNTLKTEGLVSTGAKIYRSDVNADAFLGSMVTLISRTIYAVRMYRNKLDDMNLGSDEYGQVCRKVNFKMPESHTDWSVDLVDGSSVDHYKIYKPYVESKYFWTRAPYSFTVTIQKAWLKEAFTSMEEMARFIELIFTIVRNKIELSLENLARTTLSNFMGMLALTPGRRVRNLVTEFNTIYDPATDLTATTALEDEKFLRYCVAEIRQASKEITDMSEMYNNGEFERFTPFEDQRLKVISRVQTKLETNVEYAAFHKDLVSISGFKELNFWQSKQSPYAIDVTPEGQENPVQVNNIIALLYDWTALGTYKNYEDIATTPLNAEGLYYNTVYHEHELWFNDLSENAIMFTLN